MFLEPFQNSPCFFFLANFLEKKKACTLVYLLTSQPFSNFLVPCMLPLLISDDCHVAHSLPLGPYWLPLPLFCTWPLLFLKTIIQYFLLFCSKLRGSFLALHDDVWSSQPIPLSHLPFFCRNSSSQPVLLLSYLLLCVTHSVQLKLISWLWVGGYLPEYGQLISGYTTEKNDSFSQKPLTDNSPPREGPSPSTTRYPVLFRVCADNHSFSEFLSCPKDTLLDISLSCGSYILSSFCNVSQSMKGIT